MNGQNPNLIFQNPNLTSSQSTYPPYTDIPGYQNNNSNNNSNNNQPPNLDYIENIFRINRGKKVSVYASYPDSIEWRDRVFTGVIVADGMNYVMLKQDDGNIVLISSVYINYTIFDDTASY